jgi:hypothetical protein
MFQKIALSLMLTAAFGAPAFAHGAAQQPSLLNVVASIGSHASLANVAASAAAPSTLANVHATVLDNTVKANVAVGQTARHDDSLLNLNVSLLNGGVGNHW